jgi:hypothetical protein
MQFTSKYGTILRVQKTIFFYLDKVKGIEKDRHNYNSREF